LSVPVSHDYGTGSRRNPRGSFIGNCRGVRGFPSHFHVREVSEPDVGVGSIFGDLSAGSFALLPLVASSCLRGREGNGILPRCLATGGLNGGPYVHVTMRASPDDHAHHLGVTLIGPVEHRPLDPLSAMINSELHTLLCEAVVVATEPDRAV
jgi:hypothetical protein